jgi:hypothetical protein
MTCLSFKPVQRPCVNIYKILTKSLSSRRSVASAVAPTPSPTKLPSKSPSTAPTVAPIGNVMHGCWDYQALCIL